MPDWFAERDLSPPPLRAVAVAAMVFVLLAALVAAGPPTTLERLDLALAALVRAPTSPAFDRLMIGVTMLGDFPLTLATMIALVLLLFAVGRTGLALHALALFTATKLLVTLVKVTIDRARPLELFAGGDVYSFPSGHTASVTVLSGVLAVLLLVRERPAAGTSRRSVVARSLAGCLFVLPSVLVALSRVRLGAHWPSDVVASLALGTALLLPFAWHARRLPPLPRRVPPLALGGFVAGYAIYATIFGRSVARLYVVTGGG